MSRKNNAAFAAYTYATRGPTPGGAGAVAPNQTATIDTAQIVVDSADSAFQTIPFDGTIGGVESFNIQLTPSAAFGFKVLDVSQVTFSGNETGTVQMGSGGPTHALPGFSQTGVAGWVVWWDGASRVGALPFFFG